MSKTSLNKEIHMQISKEIKTSSDTEKLKEEN